MWGGGSGRQRERERGEKKREEKKMVQKRKKKNLAKAHSLATELYSVEDVSMEIYQSGMYMSVFL